MIKLRQYFIQTYHNRALIIILIGLLLVILNFYMMQDRERNQEEQSIIERHILQLKPLTDAMAQYYSDKAHFPSQLDELKIDFAYSPKVFEGIDLYNDLGEIVIRFKSGRLMGKELFLRPILAADGSFYRWQCHSEYGERINPRQLPFQCSPSHPLNRLLQERDNKKESNNP